MLNIFGIEPGIESRFIFIFSGWRFGEFDVNLRVFFLAVSFSLKSLFIVLNDMGSFKPDDHGQTRDTSVNSVGDFQAVVETIE